MTKKVLLLASLALVLAILPGCSRCRQMTGGWFNRGDKCYPPPNCPPGVPQATMMLPTTPQVLPGPIEIAPSM
jgi:hypothetical protein